MNEIKILHLFPQLLSLYGEYGNVKVFKSVLEQNGCAVTITACEDGNADYNAFDMVYVGSGTEDNLMVALKRLMPYAEAVKASIASGKVWLATGNAMALFGKHIARGEKVPAVGAFAYATTVDDGKRFLGDVITGDAPATLGFINTSCIYTGVENPLLTLQLNKNLGNDKVTAADGIREGNFFGTQLIGPFLVKNPHYMELVASLLAGREVKVDAQSNMAKAYAVACKELLARCQ